MVSFLRLVDEWHLEAQGPWELLGWLGCESLADEQRMRWARGSVLNVAAGVFRRLDLRLAGTKLQWLLSAHTSEEEKDDVAQKLVAANSCCLDFATRRFRTKFNDVDALRGAPAKASLLFIERLLKFTTAPNECEHAATKSDMASRTSAVSQSDASYRQVCRHLHRAHIQRGGEAVALKLRRITAQNNAILGKDDTGLQAIEDVVRPPAPIPIADGSVEGARQDEVLDEEAETNAGGGGVLVRGGNPKACYINFKLHSWKQQGRSMTRAEVGVARKKFSQELDERPDLQRRWRILYQVQCSSKSFCRRRKSSRNRQDGITTCSKAS